MMVAWLVLPMVDCQANSKQQNNERKELYEKRVDGEEN